MEDPSEEWKIKEYSSEAICGKVSWMLNKGLLLGKNILIAGIVVSTTPLVLPSLLAISAIGLAVSVPSGLILASYACSEKLMRKLFPGTAAPPLLLDFGLVSNDEEICRDEEKEEGVVGFGGEVDMVDGEEDRMEETERMGEMSIELVEKEIEDNTEGKATAGADYGQGRAKKDKKEFVEDVGEYEDEEEEKPLEERIEVKHGLKEEKEEPEIEGKTDEQLLQEGHGLVVVIEGDEGSGNKVGKVETLFQGTTAALEELGCPKKVSGIEEEELLRETRVLIERLRDEGTGDDAEKDYRRRVEERQGGAEEGGDDKDQDFPLNRNLDVVISLNTDEREIVDESGLDLFDVKTVVLLKESSTNMGREAAESAERFVSATVHASSLPSEKDIIVPSSEILYNEKEIWEKIDAMRTIVGYKATPQRTCIEELKSLYIFTGVELPASASASASFKDPSDLGKVYESLQFLMSIVGVK
ncbi:uncharacterized protein LOC121259061 isoform X2 [Juglans microcarpa x Juglans regia]|uniref:uncharacterized protein LOC121259061 isoform X2 n=1 Tax=Juglans microcarpa x Juglans regia TaxID=2249226 RepID=UPI001B7F51A6|nr:uncharacterized protein LOC121259061 isoform X2 [Juglans microcarpa x Juglans regia]XP_041016481.1 uncharacterized protein LOC121259061 isoform X2 [Juglans microcarpa x Juglans regia]XP_041016482.1 uncharacterized protein LOC121259061 isoform X2 [Juglans microcarpa x Juglans regia]XP_041016483.1 uncharacterized protein LOC121259061 isoform X2 [Juglans microcarpa x Juglans regia]